MSYPGGRGGLQDDQGPERPKEKNPAVPRNYDQLLIGVVGISEDWHFWKDTPRNRDEALAWFQQGSSPKRLFRMCLDEVTELEVVPPVPAKLQEKT